MASNNQIAARLRTLAADADTELAQHDLTTLADALETDVKQDFIIALGASYRGEDGVRTLDGRGGIWAPAGTDGAEAIKSGWAWTRVTPDEVPYTDMDWSDIVDIVSLAE
jgi:N-acetylglucosamine kinase-like BadF-type ATPase